MTNVAEAGAAFHAHLDECERCENQPFNMCPEGARLLQEAGIAAGVAPPPKERKPRSKKKRRRDGKGKRRKR